MAPVTNSLQAMSLSPRKRRNNTPGGSSALLRLRTQLLIAALLIICAFTGAILFIVRQTVQSQIHRQVKDVTDVSISAFKSVQNQNELQLSRTTAMLAEVPLLKSLMTAQDAPTIQDGSEPWWKLAGSDLFVLAGPEGHVLAFDVKRSGWTKADAERHLIGSLSRGEESSWWYGNGQLYWVAMRPITAGTGSNRRDLGSIAVGYQVDSALVGELPLVAGSRIALAVGNSIVASTLPAAEAAAFERQAAQYPISDNRTSQMILDGAEYEVASVLIHPVSPTPVDRWNRFVATLNRIILVLGISVVFLAALLLSFVSRTITRPLENLVAGVRALAAGDYTYSIAPRGSTEVAELSKAFSKMRSDLLTSQQRWITAERIAALGRAASSISHDLRHYLAAVVANAEFLYEAEKLKLNRDEIYEEIKTASDQMTDLLDSLRELAREDSALSPESASLDQILRRAADTVLMRPDCRSRAVSIVAHGDMQGVFDPRKIERAFVNLILNSCEATAHWHGQVRVDAASHAESFEIRIADNGPGIPETIRDTLFDPFVSAGKPNGTGLGLAIVSKIVHDHNGSVTVEESSDRGTVFLVRLPRSMRSLPARIQSSVG